MAKDTPETIAQKIRDTLVKKPGFHWLDVISDHVDMFDMRHDPPGELDGMTSGAEVRRLNDFEIATAGKVFPNGLSVSGPVTVQGDDVVTNITLEATLRNGERVAYTSLTNWTVKDGRIVSCIARAAPSKGQKDGDGARVRDLLAAAFAEASGPITAETLGFSKRT